MSCSSFSADATTTGQSSIPRNEEVTSESSSSSTGIITSILNSRKCWRSMKGADEVVWPPELEAALIEGLAKYQPTGSKSGRPMGRFPMRNKFVSDYIFQTTGKHRTPKQVGSRIQQLRDTDTGKPILKAISDRHYAMMHTQTGARGESQSRGSTPSSSSVGTPSPRMSTQYVPPPPPSHVYLEVLPPYMAWQSQPSSIMTQVEGGRTLSSMDPTMVFTSPRNTPCFSRFYVYKGGILIHQEIAAADVGPCEPDNVSGAPLYLYTTSLVPQYWAHLCEAEEPSSYVIQAEVVAVAAASNASPDILHSVFYHFVAPLTTMTPPLSPRSSNGDSSDADLTLFPPGALGGFPRQWDNDPLFGDFLTFEDHAAVYTLSPNVALAKAERYSPRPACDPIMSQLTGSSGKFSYQPPALFSSGSPASLGSPAGFDLGFSIDFEFNDGLAF